MATDVRPQLPIIDHTPEPYTVPSRDEVLALRHQYLSPGIITYYRDPLMIVEGHMQYVWDETGRRYLDAFAGIVTISVGHCHPKVVERVREQTGKLQHTTTIYLHPTIVQMAEKLAEKMPAGLTRSYFTVAEELCSVRLDFFKMLATPEVARFPKVARCLANRVDLVFKHVGPV